MKDDIRRALRDRHHWSPLVCGDESRAIRLGGHRGRRRSREIVRVSCASRRRDPS
jgi:hypothetical protein